MVLLAAVKKSESVRTNGGAPNRLKTRIGDTVPTSHPRLWQNVQCVIPSVERGIWAGAPFLESDGSPHPDSSLDARNDTPPGVSTHSLVQDDKHVDFSLGVRPFFFRAAVFTLLLLLLFTLACNEQKKPSFTIATTTSVDNSGLLRYLADLFETETGIEPRWLAVGSGKALQLAGEGKVDLVISHDPERERKFLAAGGATSRRPFARNDFILIGPESNPAGIEAADSVPAAFRKIANAGSRFASRSDSSGTHARELIIWQEAGVTPPQNEAYLRLGQSMSALLRSARELDAYALTDRATFLQVGDPENQIVLLENDPLFENIYSVLVPSRPTSPANLERARRFEEWLTSERGQSAIASFRLRAEAPFTPVRQQP